MATGNLIEVDSAEFADAVKSFDKMIKSVDEKWVRSTQRRKAKRFFIEPMKAASHSVRLERMISVTTAKKNNVPPFGIRIGVVKNDSNEFPEFSAQALASVIEYGTAERYRMLKSAGFISGRVSTGEMPAAPFLRPSWDANVLSFMKEVENDIFQRVVGVV